MIVGAIVGAYGDGLSEHKVAGWVGIAFIYIYDVNFSYSFGKSLNPQEWETLLTTSISTDWMGLAL